MQELRRNSLRHKLQGKHNYSRNLYIVQPGIYQSRVQLQRVLLE